MESRLAALGDAMAFLEGMYPNSSMQRKVEDDAQVHAAKFLEFVRNAATAAAVPCETVVATNDHPYDAIVNTANAHGCDLIVMTARFLRGLMAMIMGSEADRVLHRASIPVLTFRALMSADHPDNTTPKSQGPSRAKSRDRTVSA